MINILLFSVLLYQIPNGLKKYVKINHYYNVVESILRSMDTLYKYCNIMILLPIFV